jgi:hypothetical protein
VIKQQQNIVIWQGDDWYQSVRLILPVGIDLVGAAPAMAIINNYKDKLLLATGICTVSPPLDVLINLPRALTATIPRNCRPEDVPNPDINPDWIHWGDAQLKDAGIKPYPWDFQVKIDGLMRTYIWGYVLVPQEVALG